MAARHSRLPESARVAWHFASSLYRLAEVVLWAARQSSQGQSLSPCEPGQFGRATAVCS
jgi:hypothetical protein